jgi:hypothetical protein
MATSTVSNSPLDSSSTTSSTLTSAPVTTTTTPAAAAPPTPAAPTPAPAAAPTTGIMPAALPIALRVAFTLNTTDGLRQISFGLEKDTDGVTTDWTITFVLFERTDPSADFGSAVVSLNVFVASPLHGNAETAAHQGLTSAQAAHATGPGADAAKAVSTGELPLPMGNRIIQGTLATA